MNKIAAVAVMALMLGSVSGFAMPGRTLSVGLSPAEILAVIPAAADKTPAELTVSEHLALAGAASIALQESAYVHRAALASLMMPGAGQVLTGNYGLAAVHAGGQLLIAGAALAGVWYLTPSNLLDLSLSMADRKTAVRAYLNKDRIGEILPTMAVVAGSMTLTAINRLVAAHQAAGAARDNLASGKVSFEPAVGMMGLRMRWH